MLKKLEQTEIKDTTKPGSKTEVASELRRCKSDPQYFIRTHVKIKHPTNKNTTPFHLYPFQEKVLKDFIAHRFNVILKSRQMGLTELISSYILWFCLFQMDKSVLIISRNRDTATEIIKRIKYSYKKLPSWLRIAKMITNNVFSIEFDNDCRISAEAATENAGRSWAGSLLVVDEAAFVPGFGETWSSLFPIVSTGGSAIINSTPNGVGDQFYDLYTKAPQNGFNPIKLNWDLHPDRNQEWFEQTKALMPPKAFAREYLCNFLESGDTVLDSNDIQRQEKRITAPLYKMGPGNNIWIWKEFNPECRYIIGADTARGDGADYSTFVVVNVDTGEVVAEFQDKIKVDRFAQLLFDIGTQKYRSPLLVVENNNHGLAVLMKLIDLKYPNLYWEQQGTHSYIEGYVDYDMDGIIPGFTTTLKSKLLVIASFEEAIRLDKIQTYSSRMITEFRDFVYVLGKPKARDNRNDDLVMALAIATHIANMVFSTKPEDAAFKMALLNRITSTTNEIKTVVPSESSFDAKKSPYIMDINDTYKATLYNGKQMDFRIFMGQKEIEKARTQRPIYSGIEFEIRGK